MICQTNHVEDAVERWQNFPCAQNAEERCSKFVENVG